MTHLAKLTFKTVDRSTKRDPIIVKGGAKVGQ